jgi:hypothetical protein
MVGDVVELDTSFFPIFKVKAVHCNSSSLLSKVKELHSKVEIHREQFPDIYNSNDQKLY